MEDRPKRIQRSISACEPKTKMNTKEGPILIPQLLSLEDQNNIFKEILKQRPLEYQTFQKQRFQSFAANLDEEVDLKRILEPVIQKAIERDLIPAPAVVPCMTANRMEATLFESNAGFNMSRPANTHALVLFIGCAADHPRISFQVSSGDAYYAQGPELLVKLVPDTCPAALPPLLHATCLAITLYNTSSLAAWHEEFKRYGHKRRTSRATYLRAVQHVSQSERRILLHDVWPQLPHEMSEHILHALDVRGLLAFSQLNTRTRTLVQSANDLWRRLGAWRYAAEYRVANSYQKLLVRDTKPCSNECSALVLSLGSYHTQIGFAGDEMPHSESRSLVQQITRTDGVTQLYAGTETLHLTGGRSLDTIVKKKIENREHVLHLIEHAFVSGPALALEEHPLLITFSSLTPDREVSWLLHKIFERWNVPCAAYASSETLSLYTHGHTSGVVVDVGHECTVIMPVLDGYEIKANMHVVPIGGRHVTLELLQRLQAQYPALSDLTEEEANEIKERYCYVQCRGDWSASFAVTQPVSIRGEYYDISDAAHESCEILFGAVPGNGRSNSLKAALAQVQEEIEYNRPLPAVRNTVVVTGGATLSPGFVTRFSETIEPLFGTQEWRLIAMAERACADWIGGSILGSLSCNQQFWKTKEMVEAELGYY